MIKIDELKQFRTTYKYEDVDITLERLQEDLTLEAEEMGLPIAFYRDVIKSGGLINSTKEEGLVVHHPEHKKDYIKICITVKRQGTTTFVFTNQFGKSKQYEKVAIKEWAKRDRKGKSLNYKIESFLNTFFKTLGANKRKYQEEEMYMSTLVDLLNKVIS